MLCEVYVPHVVRYRDSISVILVQLTVCGKTVCLSENFNIYMYETFIVPSDEAFIVYTLEYTHTDHDVTQLNVETEANCHG